jgi:hypothetical protein
MIAAEIGPGETTAPNPTIKENPNMAINEFEGNISGRVDND